MSHRLLTLLALGAPSLLFGCIQDTGPGPDPGPCATPPDGVYTWGEVGIGTCLAGPSDLRFIERDGKTWLAVVNANPYLDFASGSLVLVDLDAIDMGARENRMDQVGASAIDLDDFVGGVGYVADRDLLLVSGRLSADSNTMAGRDELWVVDASDPMALRPWAPGHVVEVRDDPLPVLVHDSEGRSYVLNLTDRSISVIDTTTTPLSVIDVAAGAALTPARFFDVDASGSTATLYSPTLLDRSRIRDDLWMLEWVDGATRLWVPTDGGLGRWDTNGDNLVASALGVVVDPSDTVSVSEVRDPFAVIEGATPVLYFANEGAIERIAYTHDSFSGVAGWYWNRVSAVIGTGTGWDAVRGAPAPVFLDDTIALYYEGRVAEGASASIGLALQQGERLVPRTEPVVEAPLGYESIEDPFVRFDGGADVRMWVSLFDGERWTIGLTESKDGVQWGEVEEVLALDHADIAAPTVLRNGARYDLWAAIDEGDGWGYAYAWSWDGRTWSEPEVMLGADDRLSVDPPRLAAMVDNTSGWRVDTADGGPTATMAFAGQEYSPPERSFSFRTASGHRVDTTPLGAKGVNGVEPGSFVEIDGVPTLFVTSYDADMRPSVAALQRAGTAWAVVSANLVPSGAGGNEAGASAPVVYETPSGFAMIYAATQASGAVRMRLATSNDGLSWAPSATPVLSDGPDWDSASRIPHSVDQDSGQIRVWYTGSNGSRSRIGAAVQVGSTFTREATPGLEWQLGTGEPGTFDDSAVADPMVVSSGGLLHMWYAGFDGERWSIGYASRASEAGARWTRPTHALLEQNPPSLVGTPRTFSDGGVRHPVAAPAGDAWEVWYAGTDGAVSRIGRAVGGFRALYETQRFPTAGDELEFRTLRGDVGDSVIELEQTFDGLTTSGNGVVGVTLDEERGFLFVAGAGSPYIYVVDVRDDSTDGFNDANYLDIEAALVANSVSGFRDVVVVPGRDLIYATGTGPEVLVAFDISDLVDDDRKQAMRTAPVATFSLQALTTPTNTPNRFGQRPRRDEDQGIETGARVGGAGLAVSDDGRYLYVTHFRDNALLVYDLTLGAYGTEIRRIPEIGENPHVVRLTPDGRHAIVANYVGQVFDGAASSTLAVVDADPTSPTFLQVVTRLVNRTSTNESP